MHRDFDDLKTTEQMEEIQKITDDHWNKNVWHTSEGVAVISEDDYDRLVEKLIKNLGDIGDVRRSSDNWKFCNTELIPEKGYCQEYRCPKCGSTSGLVNIIGLCSTKVYK